MDGSSFYHDEGLYATGKSCINTPLPLGDWRIEMARIMCNIHLLIKGRRYIVPEVVAEEIDTLDEENLKLKEQTRDLVQENKELREDLAQALQADDDDLEEIVRLEEENQALQTELDGCLGAKKLIGGRPYIFVKVVEPPKPIYVFTCPVLTLHKFNITRTLRDGTILGYDSVEELFEDLDK